MSTFLGNHDVPRAIEHALDTPLYDPWDGGKENNWSNQPPLPTDGEPVPAAPSRTRCCSRPGLPMLYYGDEYGMNRRRRPRQPPLHAVGRSYTEPDVAARSDRGARAHSRRASGDAARHAQTLGVATDTYVYLDADDRRRGLRRAQPRRRETRRPACRRQYTELIAGQTMTTPIQLPPRTAYVFTQNAAY